jgi:acyl carrier protein
MFGERRDVAGPVEPFIRRLTSDMLGVDPAQLGYEVSLIDDLAADSLDLLEIALRLESELGIAVPERLLETVRTYGDLVGLTGRLLAERQGLGWRGEPSPVVSARTLLFDDGGKPILGRAGAITPYDAEMIVRDAIAARGATELQVIVPDGTSGTDVAEIYRLFSPVRGLGIRVSVLSEGALERALDQAPFDRNHVLRIAAEAAALARELMHELQRERALMALVVGGGRLGSGLDRQLARTDRALARVRTFLASSGTPAGNPTLVHLAAALELFARPESLRTGRAEPGRDVRTVIDCYSRVNARLLDAVAALVPAVPQDDLARSLEAYLAFVCAKEEAALEGAELAYALATDSFDAGHDLALTVLMAAERSSLTVFAATAPPDILVTYKDGTADPVFDEVAGFERKMFKRGSDEPRVEASAWLAAVTAKLDRLKEIGDVQSRAIVAHVAG